MTIQNKAPTTAETVTEAVNTLHSKELLSSDYSNSLSFQHFKIMDYLAVAGNSLTTYEAAEMGWQHLPTKLSEIHGATGILCNKERLPNCFNRYTLSAEGRKQWRAFCKVGVA